MRDARDCTTLEARVEQLEALVEAQAAELARWRTRDDANAQAPNDDATRITTAAGEQPIDRRWLLRAGATGAIATAASGAMVATAGSAAAANNDPILVGQTTTGTAGTNLQYTGATMLATPLLRVSDTTSPSTVASAAIAGISDTDNTFCGVVGVASNASAAGVQGSNTASGTGVRGVTTGPGSAIYGSVLTGTGGTGVTGFASAGNTAVAANGLNGAIGIQATAGPTSGTGVQAGGGTAAMQFVGTLAAKILPPNRTDAHVRGEMDIDDAFGLWYCTESGTPGKWVQLARAGSAGTLTLLDSPARVYDSRAGEIPLGVEKGPITNGSTRIVAMTVNSSVPASARGVVLNLTITNTVGTGWLSLFPAGTSWPGTSTINWDGPERTLANGATVGLGPNAMIDVRAAGSTHFLIDVTGWYR